MWLDAARNTFALGLTVWFIRINWFTALPRPVRRVRMETYAASCLLHIAIRCSQSVTIIKRCGEGSESLWR